MWSERARSDFDSNIEKRRSDGSEPDVVLFEVVINERYKQQGFVSERARRTSEVEARGT